MVPRCSQSPGRRLNPHSTRESRLTGLKSCYDLKAGSAISPDSLFRSQVLLAAVVPSHRPETGEAHLPQHPAFPLGRERVPVRLRLSLALRPRRPPRLKRRESTGYESTYFGVHTASKNRLVKPCARHDSNMRPLPPQGSALSPELRAPGTDSVAAAYRRPSSRPSSPGRFGWVCRHSS
jgi:hypothetical protein